MEQEELQRRVCDLEIICKDIQDKLQSVINHSNNLEKLALTKAEFHDKRMSFDASIVQDREALQKNFSDIQDKLVNLKNEMASYNVYFDSHHKKIINQENKSQALQHECDSLKQQQLSHQIKLSSIDQLNFKIDNISHDHHSVKNEVARVLEDIKSNLNKLDIRLKPSESLVQLHDNKISSLEVLSRHVSDLRSSLDSLSQSHKNLEGSSQKSLEDVVNQLQSKIDRIPIIELPKPVDVNGIVQASYKDLADKLQAIAMDIENSQLRSNNNDMQIKQFEKKLENIYLLLKKHEITK